jgi:hypothetical protein
MFIRAMVRIFSFGERWSVPFNSAVASLNGTFHLSAHENILTIVLINIHYLYTNIYGSWNQRLESRYLAIGIAYKKTRYNRCEKLYLPRL